MENESKFAVFLDFVAKIVLVFCISFIWMRYFSHSKLIIFGTSITISLIFGIINFIILKKKLNKIGLKKNELKNEKLCINELKYMSNSEITTYFYNMLKDKFTISKTTYGIKEDNNEFVILFYFLKNKLDEMDFASIIKTIKTKKVNTVFVLGFSFSDEFKKLNSIYSAKKIILYDDKKIYKELMKKYNYYPIIKNDLSEKKLNRKELLKLTFNKKKTKQYILLGLVFLISSLVMRYNIYYIIFASISFIFALICLSKGLFVKEKIETFTL